MELDMETDVQPVADSSPAPVAQDPSDRLESLSKSDYVAWRKTGTIPASDAESQTAEPVEQAASTEATPEQPSEAAKPKLTKTEQRFQELLADRKAARDETESLKRRLADLERGTPRDVKPDSSPAPTPQADHERYLAMPDAPKLENYPDLPSWQMAASIFAADKRHEERTARAQQQTDQQTALETSQKQIESFNEKMSAAAEADKTFVGRLQASEVGKFEPANALMLHAARHGLPRPTLTVDNIIAQEIVESDLQFELTNHLIEHPDALNALRGAKGLPHLKQLIGRIEGRLERETAPAPTTTTKTVTSAPSVPTFVGQRPGIAPDPVARALAAKDFTAYRAAQNALDLASRNP